MRPADSRGCATQQKLEMRIIALDVHHSFAQTATLENGTVWDAVKGDLDRGHLLRFAQDAFILTPRDNFRGGSHRSHDRSARRSQRRE
jgi:hypothetical protein